MSQATIVVGFVASARQGLGLQGAGLLRVDLSQLPMDGVGLWGLVDSKGSWNGTFFTVFLLWLDGVGDTRGSWKVMVLFIFVPERLLY